MENVHVYKYSTYLSTPAEITQLGGRLWSPGLV